MRCRHQGANVRTSEDCGLWLARHVLPHEPALRGWLHSRPLAGLDVDDIIQDTYARLISLPDIDRISNIRSYMFRIAHSLIIDHVRRSRVVMFEDLSLLDSFDYPDDAASPEDEVLGRDELLHLGRAISGLPGKIRDVFIMRKVHDISQKEVAQSLGLSESTVEKHLSRGIFLLMRGLSDSGNADARASKAWGLKFVKEVTRRDARKDRHRD